MVDIKPSEQPLPKCKLCGSNNPCSDYINCPNFKP